MSEKIKPVLLRLDEETKKKLEIKAKKDNRSVHSYLLNLVKTDVKQ